MNKRIDELDPKTYFDIAIDAQQAALNLERIECFESARAMRQVGHSCLNIMENIHKLMKIVAPSHSNIA